MYFSSIFRDIITSGYSLRRCEEPDMTCGCWNWEFKIIFILFTGQSGSFLGIYTFCKVSTSSEREHCKGALWCREGPVFLFCLWSGTQQDSSTGFDHWMKHTISPYSDIAGAFVELPLSSMTYNQVRMSLFSQMSTSTRVKQWRCWWILLDGVYHTVATYEAFIIKFKGH